MTHQKEKERDNFLKLVSLLSRKKEMFLAIVSILVLKGAKESVDWFEDVSADAAGESEEP